VLQGGVVGEVSEWCACVVHTGQHVRWSLSAGASHVMRNALEVVHWHEKLAPESSIDFMPMAPISGAGY